MNHKGRLLAVTPIYNRLIVSFDIVHFDLLIEDVKVVWLLVIIILRV